MAKKTKKNERANQSEPTAEEIANLAYKMYEQEGRPQGKEVDHWLQAEMLLKTEPQNVPLAPK